MMENGNSLSTKEQLARSVGCLRLRHKADLFHRFWSHVRSPELLKLYKDRHRRRPHNGASAYFFVNQRNGAFTRFGIRDIVKKYLVQAAKKCPSLNGKSLSTHSLRHTTAVHLLEARVEPNVIKAWLGHASINSTDRYLDTDLSAKRRILERFGPPTYVASSLEPQQQGSSDQILGWLKDL